MMLSEGDIQAGAEVIRRTIGISMMAVSRDPRDVLITYALGSCVGLTLYDPVALVGGMIHCLLPLSRIDQKRAEENPCMFTDTGIPALIRAVLDQGASKSRLIAKVAGAGAPLDSCGAFQIGERNFTVLHKVLWKNGILITGQETGGSKPRTMSLYMATGVTTIKGRDGEVPL